MCSGCEKSKLQIKCIANGNYVGSLNSAKPKLKKALKAFLIEMKSVHRLILQQLFWILVK